MLEELPLEIDDQEQPHNDGILLLLVLAYIRTPLYIVDAHQFELLIVEVDHYEIAPK